LVGIYGGGGVLERLVSARKRKSDHAVGANALPVAPEIFIWVLCCPVGALGQGLPPSAATNQSAIWLVSLSRVSLKKIPNFHLLAPGAPSWFSPAKF